jgi:hypothetical protein
MDAHRRRAALRGWRHFEAALYEFPEPRASSGIDHAQSRRRPDR